MKMMAIRDIHDNYYLPVVVVNEQGYYYLMLCDRDDCQHIDQVELDDETSKFLIQDSESEGTPATNPDVVWEEFEDFTDSIADVDDPDELVRIAKEHLEKTLCAVWELDDYKERIEEGISVFKRENNGEREIGKWVEETLEEVNKTLEIFRNCKHHGNRWYESLDEDVEFIPYEQWVSEGNLPQITLIK